MSTGSRPVRDSLWARLAHDPKHGPLPILLLLLTLMTGVIDAVSIIALGRVFVANMTGNVVFIGFAVAQVPGFSLAASLSALVGFLVGAFGGGVVVERLAAHRGHLLRASCAVELLLVAISLVVIAPSASDPDLTVKVVVSAMCAAAMGVQNTVARSLAVPDLTTTVLTMTLTGIAADVRRSGTVTIVRRVLAVSAMFLGAISGALLVLHTNAAWALALVLVILLVVGLSVTLTSRQPAGWQQRA